MAIITDGMLAYMIDIGHRTGLFDAAAAGRATSAELADRAGLQRALRARVARRDGHGRHRRLRPAHADVPAAAGARGVPHRRRGDEHGAVQPAQHPPCQARRAGGDARSARAAASRTRRTGPSSPTSWTRSGRGAYDELLDRRPAARSRRASPTACAPGARAADVGLRHRPRPRRCWRDAFPASTFIGYDLDADAIDRARDEAVGSAADQRDLRGARRRRRCTSATPFDVVFVFDAIHDQADPAGVLRRIHDALGARRDLPHDGAARLEQPRGQRRPTRWRRCCTPSARCTA